MTEFAAVGNASELQDGQMKVVTIAGREVLLTNVAGKYYAAEGRCPHLGGRLWLGKLDGTVVTCPLHASRFDLTDGHVVRWTNWGGLRLAMAKMIRSPRPLKTYEVKVDQGKIMIATSEKVLTSTAR